MSTERCSRREKQQIINVKPLPLREHLVNSGTSGIPTFRICLADAPRLHSRVSHATVQSSEEALSFAIQYTHSSSNHVVDISTYLQTPGLKVLSRRFLDLQTATPTTNLPIAHTFRTREPACMTTPIRTFHRATPALSKEILRLQRPRY